MNDTNPALSAASTQRQPTHEDISRRAQELWEKYGRPGGRDEEIWLEAERDLQREYQPVSAREPSAPPATAPSASSPQAGSPSTLPSGATAPTRPPGRTSRASASPRMPGGRKSGAK